ncbi:oligosaccharide flippase family protein [Croceicoccus sp. BE223]|uniref:oligosaccharide flippase family protein n=1 Tax=Croceicoccus sp. BE223 TaxID=2817716 RepID=UPI00285B0142|nr:oligosaccharide flippase family protein [Croceicoccus sp. BE223]MDR7104036.1 O-antigen/teichoic acid export membrane protein [Croceicoccus sp. BE223]
MIGSAWGVGGTVLTQIIAFLVLAILARHLDARDFGVVALVIVSIELTRDLMLAGLPDYLVRERDWNERIAASGFYFQIGASLVLALLAGVGGMALAAVGRETVGNVMLVLAVCYPIDAIAAIPLARLRHGIRYQAISAAMVTGGLASAAVSIFVVLNDGGLWALVYGRIAGAVVNAAAVLLLARWTPSSGPSFHALRPVWRISLSLAGSRLLNILNLRVTDLIVGAVGGTTVLGLYQLATRGVTFLLQAILAPIQSVALSAFSSASGRDEVVNAAHRMFGATAILVFPAAAGLSAISPEFVEIAFGDRWADLALPAGIVALTAIPAVVNYLLTPILIKLDRSAEIMRFSLILTGTSAAIAAGTAPFGITIVAIGFVSRSVVGCFVSLSILKRDLGVSVVQFLKPLAVPFLGALLVFAVVFVCRVYLSNYAAAVRGFFLVIAGIMAYVPFFFFYLTRRENSRLVDWRT